MPALVLDRTLEAQKITRLHRQLEFAAASRAAPVVNDEPCIGAKMAAFELAVRDLMAEHDFEMKPEARTVLRVFAPLGFRCRDLWRSM